MKEFFEGLSAFIKTLSTDAPKLAGDAIGRGIEEGVKKSSEKLFSLGISIALLATGFFLTLWGIATSIDMIFAMRGLGYVLIGVLAALLGALVYKK